MKLLHLALKRETAVPILALSFASIMSFALVCTRIFWSGNVRYSFLIWNLFLAWLPLCFALLASHEYGSGSMRKWRFGALSVAWLLFFPNAPYICTDLIHLTTQSYTHFWVDMVLILLCALTGLVLGFVSLYLMHGVVKRMLGSAAGWGFIVGVAGLSGFGIYLGRFLRLNSWDVVFNPLAVAHSIGKWAADPFAHSTSFAFPALFAVFLLITYVMLYALTHLREMQRSAVVRPGADF